MADDEARPDEGEETRTPESRDPQTEAPKPPKPTETVEFWKAMSRKNEKAAKELEELKAAQLSKEERSAKEAAAAKEEAAAARAEALRLRVAVSHGISQEDAELFLTATDEETLNRQAERLNERTPQPAKGAHVPNLGQQPEQPPNLDEQIRMAEAGGDTQTAMSLKTLKLAELARQSR
ncbi:MAG: hypothetical protein K0U84_18350 [Actinomycetia bacterium]|nr:hypothetical protein [Actinomycetes bacterium]